MKPAIEGRELILLNGDEVTVWGTYHKVSEDASVSPAGSIERSSVGVVFLNGLAATRAAHGDAAVYWADAFAAGGYPSFRLDLPGFGDAEGEPPGDWPGFISRGGYASIVSVKIAELVKRFTLAGVIVMGQCGGAVSAIYAASTSAQCKGLILMEPYFHMPKAKALTIPIKLHLWGAQNRAGRILRKAYHFLKTVRTSFQKDALPENANLPLLRCWKELASGSRPILILNASGPGMSGPKLNVGQFDYFKHVMGMAGRKGELSLRWVSGTNHTFANSVGRVAVRDHTEEWLHSHFPLVSREEAAVSPLCTNHEDDEIHHESRKNVVHR